jgi:PAS domain S-box-containing protein
LSSNASKSWVYRLLRKLPMPVIAIVLGFATGLGAWAILDQVQSRQVGKIFGQELQVQLELQARESMVRFDRYLAAYSMTTRLLANHRRLAEYLEPIVWSEESSVPPVVYRAFRPYWLPDFFARGGLRAPTNVLLVDPQGRVREEFQSGELPLPAELAEHVPSQFLDPREVRTVPVRLDQGLFLLVSDAVEDSGGYPMGHLVVLVPIDDGFLAASQRGIDPNRAAVALVDADDQRIVASSDSEALIPGTTIDMWDQGLLVTSQALPGYEGVDSNLLFATVVTQASVERMSRHVRIFERRQRFYAALAFILVFTGVIYLVSARLNRILKRMTRFSQRALGIPEPGFRRDGNQLLLLEDWIRHFTRLVLKAREEMNRRHQAEMRESEALKAAMMEASLDAIVTLDHEGRIIEVNPAAERIFSLGRQEAIGSPFAERFLPDLSRTAFGRLLQRSRQEGLEHHGRGELIALRADGIEIPVEISIVPIDLESERFYTLYIHDITSRKQAEREIKSLARFAAESPNPILRVTMGGVIVYANNASRPLLLAWGTEQGELLPDEWVSEAMQAMELGEPQEREVELGGQVYALLFAPIRDLGYVNIYGRDITAVRRAEQQSRQHQAELVHVSRLSTMGEVATGMAHELNQPLSAIVNYANGCTRRMQSGAGQTEELLGALFQITSQARRASEIIRRLRALVGKQPPIRADVDLNHLVQEVCSFLEFETAKLGVQIEMDLAPEPITVHVDLVQIEQVLLNLLSNALDALEDTPEAERRLIIRTRGGVDGEARVSVEDSGPGMEPERLAHLFDPFFTTKEGGMGMGLTISQTILENHEGRIWAESEPGQGTVFHVALPGVGEAQRDDSGTAEAHGEPEPSTGALRALGASR